MDSIQLLWFWAFHRTTLLALSLHIASGRSCLLTEETLELNTGQLNSLKLPFLKTIKTEYGGIYDCVELYKQPAFGHPLLKHHKIQMRPSFAPQKSVFAATYNKDSLSNSIAVGLKEDCPSGTVPIRITTEEEILRAKASFQQQFQGSYSPNEADPVTSFMFAGLSTAPKKETRYLEAGGYATTHNPIVGPGQVSASVISIEDGPADQFSTIRVGWMVNPNLYGDNHTRLYTVWGQANGGAMHGCYNTLCPGFVQTDTRIPLDMVIQQISVPHGSEYSYIQLRVSLDKSTGNWWLSYGDISVGYWPNAIFLNLKESAEVLRWGGMVYSNWGMLPDMGSGEIGEYDASHYRQVSLKFESSAFVNGTADAPLEILQTTCYKAGDNRYSGEFWGYTFWYGGKGNTVQQCM